MSAPPLQGTLVEVRGTGGSGKTTVARRVMAAFGPPLPVPLEGPMAVPTMKKGELVWSGSDFFPDTEFGRMDAAVDFDRRRRRGKEVVLGNRFCRADRPRPLFVVGDYKRVCGGADTFPQPDLIYSIAAQGLLRGADALLESYLLSLSDHQRTVRFPVERHVVVCLTTPGEVAFASINLRRIAAGKEPFPSGSPQEKRIIGDRKTVENNCLKMRAAGLEVLLLDRDEAPAAILAELGVRAPAGPPPPAPEPDPEPECAPAGQLAIFGVEP